MKNFLGNIRSTVETVLDAGPARYKNDRLAAFDVNNYQVKLVVMRKVRGKLNLEGFHVERLEDEESSGRRMSEFEREAIRRLAREYKLKGCDVISSLPYSGYSVRLVVLPRMPAKDLRKAVLFDHKKNASARLENAVIDYVTVDSFQQEGTEYQNHLVAAIDRDAMAKYIEVMNEAGLDVRGFSAVPLALRNVLNANGDLLPQTVCAVLNLSYEETSFSLINNKKLMFTRELPRTNEELTDALTTIVTPEGETLRLSKERAREIKYEYGILADGHEVEKTDEGIPLENIAVMMRPVLEKMLVEIRRSIDFCQEQFGIQPPDKIFLSGGGSLLKNLPEYLSSRLRMPVEYMDPIKSLELGPAVAAEALRSRSLFLASALGMAMNLVGGQGYFVPKEFIQSEARYLKMTARAAAAVSVLLVGGSLASTHVMNSRWDSLIESKAATLEKVKQTQAKYAPEAEKIKLQKIRRDALLSLIGPEIRWGNVLKDLSHRIGRDVQLTDFQSARVRVPGGSGAAENRIRFQGLISLRNDRLEAITSDLLAEMNRSPYLEDVRLDNVRTLDDEIASFDVSCRLLPEKR